MQKVFEDGESIFGAHIKQFLNAQFKVKYGYIKAKKYWSRKLELHNFGIFETLLYVLRNFEKTGGLR